MTEQSLAALAGHDEDARQRLTSLLDRYRREGIAGLRAAAAAEFLDVPRMPTAREFELVALLVEAVLTLAERTGTVRTARRNWADFDHAEAATDLEHEAKGGNA